MAIVHYTAKVKDCRTLELPDEAHTLGLQAGDEVHVFVDQEDVMLTETLKDEAKQAHLRGLTDQLFAETDAMERHSGTYVDPQKARIAAMIDEKHRKIGLQE